MHGSEVFLFSQTASGSPKLSRLRLSSGFACQRTLVKSGRSLFPNANRTMSKSNRIACRMLVFPPLFGPARHVNWEQGTMKSRKPLKEINLNSVMCILYTPLVPSVVANPPSSQTTFCHAVSHIVPRLWRAHVRPSLLLRAGAVIHNRLGRPASCNRIVLGEELAPPSSGTRETA